MPKYRVSLMRLDEFTMDFEAPDEDEAIDMAFDAAPHGICAQDSGWGQKWSLDAGEWCLATEFNEGNINVELIDE